MIPSLIYLFLIIIVLACPAILLIGYHWPILHKRHVLRKNLKYLYGMFFHNIFVAIVIKFSKTYKKGLVRACRFVFSMMEKRGFLDYVFDPEKVGDLSQVPNSKKSGLIRKWVNGPVEDGKTESNWRLFVVTPKKLEQQKDRDTLIYFHGGRMIMGSPIPIATMVAKYTGKQVIGVKYRLSPESSYPEPILDCIQATRYILQNTSDFSIGKFGLFGESAGGHLALSVNMEIDYMSEFGVKPEVISSIEPMTQCADLQTASYLEKTNYTETPPFIVRMCWLLFAGVTPDQAFSKETHEIMKSGKHTVHSKICVRLPQFGHF